MEFLVKLLMNSFYGEHIRKDIEEESVSTPEYWMLTEYDERVKEYRSAGNGKFIVKVAQDESVEDDNEKVNVMPLHLDAIVQSNSKRIMNIFAEAAGGFKTNDVYYDVQEMCIW